MKIAVIIHSLEAGGAERVTSILANYWVDKKYEVVLVTLEETKADFYRVKPVIKRIVLQPSGVSGGVLKALVKNPRRIIDLRKILKKERPDVAIGIMAEQSVLLAIAGFALPPVLIGTERNFPNLSIYGHFRRSIRKFVYGMLDVVVVQTQKGAEWLLLNTTVKSTAVIPNPVSLPLPRFDLSKNRPKIRRGSSDKKTLLGAGRLVSQKDFGRLIGVFAELAPNYPEWQLVILGEGPLRNDLEQQVDRLNLNDRVLLPGRVGDIGNWYRDADIYALTSEYEGFPNTLLEAMAHELPVISVDCDTGPRDIIRPEVDGLLVPQNDDVALYNALERCMSNDAFRESLAKNAMDVRNRYSVDRIGAMWDDIFFEIRK